MKAFQTKLFPRIDPDSFWGRVTILMWVLIKLTLVAFMTNDSTGSFIYAGF